MWRVAWMLALVVGVGCGGGSGDDAGVDYVLFDAADDATEGTAHIVLWVELGACLADACGSDEGTDGVAGASCLSAESLCDPANYDEAIVDCEVAEITHTLNTQGELDVAVDRVEYEIGGDSPAGAYIPLGPFPTEATAGCEPVLVPASMSGFDGMNNGIWQAATFDPAEVTVGVDHVVAVAP